MISKDGEVPQNYGCSSRRQIKLRRIMNRKIGGTVLVIIGVLFILVALFYIVIYGIIGGAMHGMTLAADERREEFIENVIETVGEVTEVSRGSTIVEFMANKEVYRVSINVSAGRYGEGEDIIVYYNESNPYNCDIPDLQEFGESVAEEVNMKFSFVFGTICFVVGFFMINRGSYLLKGQNIKYIGSNKGDF